MALYPARTVQGDLFVQSSEHLFDDAAEPKTQVSFAKPGRFVLKLSASDGELTGYHYVTILVKE